MHKKIIEFNTAQRTKALPKIQTGDTIRVHRKIVEENKERLQIFEGLVIALGAGQSSSPTMTVRKTSFGVGVEIVLPMHSPNIEKIELVKRAKIRRSKLYFVRNKADKEIRRKLRDIPLTEEDKTARGIEQKAEIGEKITKEVTEGSDKQEEVVAEATPSTNSGQTKEEPKQEEVEDTEKEKKTSTEKK